MRKFLIYYWIFAGLVQSGLLLHMYRKLSVETVVIAGIAGGLLLPVNLAFHLFDWAENSYVYWGEE